LLDTGSRSAAENLALNEAILKARGKELIPNTVRFLQFNPNAVLVGYHQCVEHEVRVDYCKEHSIDINRRITGGGAIYFDLTQLGWELYASKDHPLIPRNVEEIYKKVSNAFIKGLEDLGVHAAFRPKNDIEVNGRKISGTGGALEGNAFLFQGTLLTDFDVETMISALRIPTEKLKDKELDSVKERVTCLKWELGQLPELDKIKAAICDGFSKIFDVEMEPGELTQQEKKIYDNCIDKFHSDKWIYGIRKPVEHRCELRSTLKTKGGLLRVSLVVDVKANRILFALITGDFFAYPGRTIFDLEGRLKDTTADFENIKRIVLDFFSERQPEIPGVTPEDFLKVIDNALKKVDYNNFGIDLVDANSVHTIIKPYEELQNCSVLLLPYCAKLFDCEYRQKKDCTQCGECTVGDAYELAENAGLEVITILNYEDLEQTLETLKVRGVEGFIGSCCEEFYVKHQKDFERLGVPGVLIDIDNRTCYDLGKEKDAYIGKFENQTNLKMELLKKVMKQVCK
jgi:lipoate-protein ligase A